MNIKVTAFTVSKKLYYISQQAGAVGIGKMKMHTFNGTLLLLLVASFYVTNVYSGYVLDNAWTTLDDEVHIVSKNPVPLNRKVISVVE